MNELEQLLRYLESRFPNLAHEFRQNGNCTVTNSGALVKALCHQRANAVAPELYEYLRSTRWSIHAWSDSVVYRGGKMVKIVPKRYFEPVSPYCFHVTPKRNWPNKIENRGLFAGYLLDSQTTRWEDARFYIHVSSTLEEASQWPPRLCPQERAIVIPIKLVEARLRLYEDPSSRGVETCEGYILDNRVHVSPEFLGQPRSI